jgi:transposase InsO family protein
VALARRVISAHRTYLEHGHAADWLAAQLAPLRAQIQAQLEQCAAGRHTRTANFAAGLLDEYQALWTFADVPDLVIDPTNYGYRKMWLALGRAGHEVGRDHVKRLMRAHGVQGAKRRGKPWRTTTRDPAATRSPDLVKRDFTAMGPDELWLADFTYLRCWEGVVFFSFVIDAYSRRVVGWQFAGHMRTDLVTDALRMALTRRDAGADVALIHHSDAGSQYTSYAFQQVLDDHAVLGSIGSVGDAYDTQSIMPVLDAVGRV